jgi:hypothetical protein
MKAFYKILLLCTAVFALYLFITKKSIDYTFRKVECSQTDFTVTDGLYTLEDSIEV